MTAMLDSYVSFVKTEAPETIENININEILKEILKILNKKKIKINFEEKNKLKHQVDHSIKKSFSKHN